MIEVTLDNLRPAPAHINSRKHDSDVKQLAASIKALGQLQPILIRPLDESTNTFEIVDGHRRYAAMKELANGCADAWVVTANVVHGIDDKAATEMSLAANVVREQLHPVDEYEAFAELVKQGMGVKEIAQAFAITQTQVKQRIALGDAIPEVREAWRNEKINTETFKAFANAPRDRQERVWATAQADGVDGWRVYSLLKNEVINRKHEISRWIDDARYKQAGGDITRDLFGDDDVYEHKELALTVAREALAEWKNAMLKEGWADVICPQLGDEVISNAYSYRAATPADYTWDSLENMDKAQDLEGYELRQWQQKHATPFYDPADMATHFLYVDENWHLHMPLRMKEEKKKEDKADEPVDSSIPASLKDDLDAVFTDEMAMTVMRNQALADALALNALVESFIGRSWGQPLTLRGELSKAHSPQAVAARSLKDLAFEKMTTIKRVKAIMNMSKKDVTLLRASLIASFILGTNNKGDLAKLVGPGVQIEHRWNDELKQRYFGALKKPQLIQWLDMFAGIQQPDSAKKSDLVAKCVECCTDWMPDELKPQKKSEVLE